jgi:hypothetical protein
VGAYLAMVLGLAHLSFTPVNYRALTLNALWFASAGLAILFGGFLNLALNRSTGADRAVRGLSILANALLAVLFLMAIRVLPQPQVFLGAALFAFLMMASFVVGRK